MNNDNKLKIRKKHKILFVCLGNICRSPAAEGVMRHLLELHQLEHLFEIDSEGIGSWHVGDLPDRRMRQCGASRGYNLNHRARQISDSDFERFDYIIGMDHENMSTLKRMKSRQPDAKSQIICLADYLQKHTDFNLQQHPREVPDPYYGSQRDFEFALDLIEDACEGLLHELVTSL